MQGGSCESGRRRVYCYWNELPHKQRKAKEGTSFSPQWMHIVAFHICVSSNTDILKTWKFSLEITFEIWSDPRIIAWHPTHQLIQEIGWWHWHATRSCTVCFLCGYQANSKEKQTDKQNLLELLLAKHLFYLVNHSSFL